MKALKGPLYISDIFGQSWKLFKKNWLKVYALLLLPMLVGFLYNFLMEVLGEAWVPLLVVVYMVIQMIISMGVIKALLALVRGRDFDIDTILSTKHLFLKYLGANLLYMFAVIIGLILLVIPGIYLMFKYMFASYAVIDEEMGPIEAMKHSAKLTKGVKWDIAGFMFAAAILTYSGLLALIVGIFVTAPVAVISYVMFYEILRKRIKA